MSQDYKKVQEDDQSPSNPKENAGFCSLFTFSWLTDLLAMGQNQPLESEDLFSLLVEDQSEDLTDLLEREWRESVGQEKPTTGRWIGLRLVRALWGITPAREYCLILTLLILASVARLSLPLFLIGLLALLMENSSTAASHNPWVYYYASGISVSAFVMAMSKCHLDCRCSLVGMRVRAGLVGLIYKKVCQRSTRWYFI